MATVLHPSLERLALQRQGGIVYRQKEEAVSEREYERLFRKECLLNHDEVIARARTRWAKELYIQQFPLCEQLMAKATLYAIEQKVLHNLGVEKW